MGKLKVKKTEEPDSSITDSDKSDYTQNTEAVPENEDSEAEVVLELDSDEASEVFDFMEPDDPTDLVSHHSGGDDDSEANQDPFISPERIARKIKAPKSRSTSREYRTSEERDEEATIKSRWLLTTCRYCLRMFRFRSDEPEPPTCGSPQCIEKSLTKLNRKKSA